MARYKETTDVPDSGTVTVACKLPNGLKLRLHTMVDVDMPLMGGGVKTVKEARPNPEVDPVTINGAAFNPLEPARCLVVGGYALTPNVDAQFMAEWLKQNARSPLVLNKLVLIHEAQADAQAEAKEKTAVRSGLEPLMKDKDPRAPKRVVEGEKVNEAA